MFWHAQRHAAKIRAAVKAGGKSGMVPLSLNLGGAAWARQRWPPAPSAPGRRRRAAAAARLSVIAAKAASAGTGPSTGGSARRRRRRGTVPPRPLDAQDTIQLPLAARQLAVAAAEEHDLLRVLLRAHERGPQVRLGLDARKGEDAERRADDQGRDRRVQGGDGEHGDEALGHEPVEHRQERAALDHVHDELDAQAQDLGFFCAWGFLPSGGRGPYRADPMRLSTVDVTRSSGFSTPPGAFAACDAKTSDATNPKGRGAVARRGPWRRTWR